MEFTESYMAFLTFLLYSFFKKWSEFFYWILKAFLKGAIVENALIFNIPVT